MFKRLHEEVKNIQSKDAENPTYLNVLFLYPSMQIKYFYKVAKLLKKFHLTFFAYLILRVGRMVTGIEINLGAELGKRIFIDHGMGVVIGSTAIIGDDVVLYHGVTLGATKFQKGRRHPKIGNNVVIGAGAKILGDVSIGDNSKIGANAVVTKNIPPGVVAVGIPAKIIKKY